MKRTLIALLAGLVLVGCSTSAPTASGPATTGGAPETKAISVMASQGWVHDAELELAKKYEQQTGVHIDYQISPSDQYTSLLTTKLNAGQAADIFMSQSGKFDIVSNLQIEKNGVDLSDQEWVSRFNSAVKEQVSANGKVFGISIWDLSDSYVYLYNKTIFAKHGLNPPTSFADFKATCAKLAEAGIQPIFQPMKDGWHHQLNFFDVSAAYDKSDPNLVADLNANKTTFAAHPIFKQMIGQMKEIYDAGYWGENALSDQVSNGAPSMANGKAAMYVGFMGGISDIVAAKGKYGADDFGIFAAPYLDNTTISETPAGPSKFIYSKSPNIEAAKKYLSFLAQPENLQFMIDNEPTFNMVPFSGLKAKYSTTVSEAISAHKPGTSTVYQNAVIYLNPQWMDFGKDLTAYLTGDMSADDVIATIDQRRADQADTAQNTDW